ncbi:MAG: PAS domain S-box protein [Desulfobacterales bacterium]
MVRAWLIKMGIVWSTIAITAIACLSSVLLYLLLSFFFGGYSDIGVSRSIAIPLVIVPVAAFYVLKIIFQLHRSEAALADSEEKYRLLFNHAPSGIYEIDFIKGRLTNVNDVLCKYSGYSREELLTMSVFDFLAKESRDAFKERLEKLFKGEAVPDLVEYQIKTKPGTTLWVLLNARYTYENGIPVGATVIIHNIDEQKKQALEKARLEEALRQAHKMEALGTLAGGIAHDFNNILSAIMGYTEIARLGVPADAKVRTHLDKVMVACDRAKEMVRQILAFSRKSEFKKRPVRIAQVVKEAGELLGGVFAFHHCHPHGYQFRKRFCGRGSYSDSSDYNESLHQCGIRHARKGGTLSIRLEDLYLDENDVAAHPETSPGAVLHLSIADTGCGIPSQVMDRIFDPYFSTKPKSEGTGLGLSIVHGLVTAHQGFLSVDSDFGKGTTFHVFLPRSEGKYVPEKPTPPDMPSGTEQILLVDDEQDIVRSAVRPWNTSDILSS